MSMYIGVDLGQQHDYTAICVVELLDYRTGNVRRWTEEVGDGLAVERRHEERVKHYHLRHLERHLGRSYVAIADRVIELTKTPELKAADVVLDMTGVGRPVADMLRDRGVAMLYPVTITGGDKVTNDGEEYRVPKRDLVSTMQVLMQNRRLRIASTIPLRETLVTELSNFKVKINESTGHDTYEHWRDSDHDDLVLAVALACWFGEEVGTTWLYA